MAVTGLCLLSCRVTTQSTTAGILWTILLIIAFIGQCVRQGVVSKLWRLRSSEALENIRSQSDLSDKGKKANENLEHSLHKLQHLLRPISLPSAVGKVQLTCILAEGIVYRSCCVTSLQGALAILGLNTSV